MSSILDYLILSGQFEDLLKIWKIRVRILFKNTLFFMLNLEKDQ